MGNGERNESVSILHSKGRKSVDSLEKMKINKNMTKEDRFDWTLVAVNELARIVLSITFTPRSGLGR